MFTLGSKHYNSAKHNIKTISSLSTQKTNTTIHQKTKPPLLLSPTSHTYPPTHTPTYINFKVKQQQLLQKKYKNTQSSSLDSSPKTHIFVKCVQMHTKQKLFSPSSTPLSEALTPKTTTTQHSFALES
jgi:hypothetical protein